MLQLNLLPAENSYQAGVLLGMSEDLPDTKVCLGPCGRDLFLDCFKKHKTGRFGRVAWCKECLSKKEKEHRKLNPLTKEQRKVVRDRSRVFRDTHPLTERQRESESKRYKEYYSKNSEHIIASAIAWKKSNPEKARATYQAWFESNPEKSRAASRSWRKNNPDKVRELYVNWVASNQERVRELRKRWHTEHPEYRRFRHKVTSNSSFTFDQWLELLVEFNHQCAYCGRSDVPLTMDHRVAIVNGGHHTKDNIVPACRPCNSRKGAKDPSLFKLVVQRAPAHKDTETGA
jgi:5-methylcytosine-specific restriction endonuclease McrA